MAAWNFPFAIFDFKTAPGRPPTRRARKPKVTRQTDRRVVLANRRRRAPQQQVSRSHSLIRVTSGGARPARTAPPWGSEGRGTGLDRTGLDGTRHDTTRHDTTQDKTRQDKLPSSQSWRALRYAQLGEFIITMN